MFLIYGFILVCLSTLISSYGDHEQDKLVYCEDVPEYDQPCYCAQPADDIPQFEEKTVRPRNSIFFIDTSCNGELDFRQSCSIESVARSHPETDINVLFLGPVTTRSLSSSSGWEILRYPNVNIYRIYLSSYLKNTPLDVLTEDDRHIPVRRISDILRFVTLYKYGGIYMDAGVVVVKSLYMLPEWRDFAGKVTLDSVGARILGISRKGIGQMVAQEIFRRLVNNFRNKTFWQTSNEILTDTLETICDTSDVAQMSSSACKGFELYDPYYFYSVRYDSWKSYFAYTNGEVPSDPFGFFVWDFITEDQMIYKNSPYIRLLQHYCPRMKRTYYNAENITAVKQEDDLMLLAKKWK